MSQLRQIASACPPSAFHSAYPKNDPIQQTVNGGEGPSGPTQYQLRIQHQFPAQNTTLVTSQIGSDASDFATRPQPDSFYNNDFTQAYNIGSHLGRNHLQHP